MDSALRFAVVAGGCLVIGIPLALPIVAPDAPVVEILTVPSTWAIVGSLLLVMLASFWVGKRELGS